jgi:hypothetical protein
VGAASALLGILFIAEQWSDPTQRFSGENIAFVAFGALLIGAALIARMDAAGRDASQTFLGTMHLGRWATVITAIFLVRAAVQTNYLYAGKETEYLSQVHTTYELAEFAKDISETVFGLRCTPPENQRGRSLGISVLSHRSINFH